MSQSKRVAVIVSLMFLCGCNEKAKIQSEYINHNKWLTYRSFIHRNPLKGNPKEVTETVYYSLSDTTTDATGKILHSEINHFDEDGNVTYMKLHTPLNNSQTEIFLDYDTNGMHYRSVSKALEGTERDSVIESVYRSERVGLHKFSATRTFRGRPESGTTILSFENDGNLVKVEGRNGDSVITRIENIFAGDTLLAWRSYQSYGISLDSYYYSRKGFLDSMVTKINDSVSTRHIFINNEYGDPVYKLMTNYGVVVEMERFVYRYDEKGNWIRKLTYFEKDGSAKGDYPYLGHTLWVREIKY